MNKLKKFIIGVIIAFGFCFSATPASAAVAVRAVAKKAVQKCSNYIWKNRGAVAVGATTTAVVLRPDAVFGGALKLASTPFVSSMLFYLLFAMLVIAGIRYFLHRAGLWRVLPLVIVGLLLCAGLAEAGVVDCVSVPTVQFITKPLWDVVMIIIVAISLFF